MFKILKLKNSKNLVYYFSTKENDPEKKLKCIINSYIRFIKKQGNYKEMFALFENEKENPKIEIVEENIKHEYLAQKRLNELIKLNTIEIVLNQVMYDDTNLVTIKPFRNVKFGKEYFKNYYDNNKSKYVSKYVPKRKLTEKWKQIEIKT